MFTTRHAPNPHHQLQAVSKEEIINCIRELHRTKPKHWKAQSNALFRQLEKMEDPFADLVWVGNENLNRKIHIADCPDFTHSHDDDDDD